MKRGKKYVEAAKAVDRATLYDTAEAISLVKKSAVAKFDETIEVHIRTGSRDLLQVLLPKSENNLKNGNVLHVLHLRSGSRSARPRSSATTI